VSDQSESIGKRAAIPGAEFDASAVAGRDSAKDPFDDTVLAMLRIDVAFEGLQIPGERQVSASTQ
jgi:hypothetical protein